MPFRLDPEALYTMDVRTLLGAINIRSMFINNEVLLSSIVRIWFNNLLKSQIGIVFENIACFQQ